MIRARPIVPRSRTVAILLALLAVGGFARASDAWKIAAGNVTVIYADAALEPVARRAAAHAASALERVSALFGVDPAPVVLTLSDATDAFNAVATPLPRPSVALRTVPPIASGLGLDASDWLELLIVHELTHVVHFAGTGPAPLGLGFVGEGVAPPPPLWLVEGVATWAESELTGGGRRDDARTRGLLAALALEGEWPSLGDASTGSHEAWPRGEARYLLGARFVEHLARTHGWETFVDVLRAYNHAPFTATFAAVWQQRVGTDLEGEWERLRSDVLGEAGVRAAAARAWAARASADDDASPHRRRPERGPERITDTGHRTGLPAISPDGARLAWRAHPAAVAVAPWSERGLGDPAHYASGVHPQSLAWLDDRTIAFTALHHSGGTSFAELFVLDLDSGRHRRVTTGGRAHLVSGPAGDGCVRYVRAAPPAAPSIREWCRGGVDRQLWSAPAGTEIVGLAVQDDGPMVVSLWRNGRANLVLVDGAGATPLTAGHALDLDPVWTRSGCIRFRSDRDGRFELHELDPASGRLRQLTLSVGGAFQPTSGSVFVTLGGDGLDLARLPEGTGEPCAGAARGRTREGPPADAPEEFAVAARAPPVGPPRRYSPLSTLAPFGWLPTGGNLSIDPWRLGLEATAYAQDAAGLLAWSVTGGFDTALTGPMGPSWLYGTATWRPHGLFTAHLLPPPVTASIEAGVWPHHPHLAPARETALGVAGTLSARTREGSVAASARLRIGLVHLVSAGGLAADVRADAAASTSSIDRWGYPLEGASARLAVRWTPSATGPSGGAWVDGEARVRALGGVLGGQVRAGYRPSPPVPLALGPVAATGGLEARWSLPARLRYGDGRYALERLTVTPAVRLWADEAGVGAGADLAVGADLLLNYAAPVALVVQGGWAHGAWWGIELRSGF